MRKSLSYIELFKNCFVEKYIESQKKKTLEVMKAFKWTN